MVIKCEKKLAEAKAFAQKTNNNSLEECLERLRKYEETEYWGKKGLTVYLYGDPAPFSFRFEVLDKNNQRVVHGGLLYHGNPDRSYAVYMKKEIGWDIHT